MPKPLKKRLRGECPNCGGDLMLIGTQDHHGLVLLHEKHCNDCGFCIDMEGKIRNEGRELPPLGSFKRSRERF